MRNKVILVVSNKSDYRNFKIELGESSDFVEYFIVGGKDKDSYESRFFDTLLLDLYSIYLSSDFYSHYHNIRERKPKSFFRRFIRLVFWKIHKYNYKLFDNIFNVFIDLNMVSFYRILKFFNNYIISNLKINVDSKTLVIFCGTITTSMELDILRKAISCKANIGIITRNWDNPSSKTFVPSRYISFITSWSEQMDSQYKKIFKNKNYRTYRYLSPRLSYLTQSKTPQDQKLDGENLFYVLYAGSQKMISHEIKLLHYISNGLVGLEDQSIRIIYRPHPWNNIEAEEFRSLITSKYIILDEGINKFLAQGELDLPFAFNKEFGSSLTNSLKKANILITPAGTLSLEAALLDKPTIVDLSHSKQVTLKLIIYMDHFNDYVIEDWVFPCFSFCHIFNQIRILKSSVNKLIPFKEKALKYGDIYSSQKLTEILEYEMNN